MHNSQQNTTHNLSINKYSNILCDIMHVYSCDTAKRKEKNIGCLVYTRIYLNIE